VPPVDNAVLLIAGAVVISAAGQMCSDPRVSKRFAQKRKLTTALYAQYGAMSLAALIAFVPRGQIAAFGAFAAVFGWIGLGVLAFVRFSPGPDTPARVLHVGGPDIACLVAIAAGMSQAMLLT
jgi:membrane associated rhomboid family serine protease